MSAAPEAIKALTESLRDSLRPRGPVNFKLSERRKPGRTVLRPSGELDVLTVPKLASALDQAVRHETGQVVVDLRDVEFIDSAGLHVLLNAQRRLTRNGRRLAVVCESGQVRRVIELARLTETFHVVASPNELDAAPSEPGQPD